MLGEAASFHGGQFPQRDAAVTFTGEHAQQLGHA